jgi:hypothetical protein
MASSRLQQRLGKYLCAFNAASLTSQTHNTDPAEETSGPETAVLGKVHFSSRSSCRFGNQLMRQTRGLAFNQENN